MMFDIWRDVVMKAVLERFSPLALKVLTNPQVQALMTQALNLQADMRQNIESQVKLVARTLELVTRDELTSLRAVVKELEAEIARLNERLKEQEAARAAEPHEHLKEQEPPQAAEPPAPPEPPPGPKGRKPAPAKKKTAE